MHLYELPVICILVALAMYTVLGGADFGAGLWQLLAGRGRGAERIREYAHHAMGPVWEANHVWLIFVLVVTWTAYPEAFGSIASTLSVPLFIAALGVIFRGAAYALRAGSTRPRELALIDTVFSISSVLAPFALGAVVGAIASLRVPPGNAAGDLFSSWLTPTSCTIGALAVAAGAYMAAVYLAGDATRAGERELAEQFRTRALIAGAVAGGLALAGLIVLHSDSHRLYHRLTDGPGLAGLVLSILAGLTTLALVARRRFDAARVTAALAVAGVILGWALAQQPLLLQHLTLRAAAAPRQTLITLLVAIAMGALILFPSLGLLFTLVLGGRFDPGHGHTATWRSAQAAAPAPPAVARAQGALAPTRAALVVRVALAAALGGIGLLTVAEAPWAHAAGVVCLFAAVIAGVVAVDPARLARAEDRSTLRD